MTDPTDDRTGQCLCGSVTYWAQRPLLPVRHCHCENCRRTSGNFVAASRSATSVSTPVVSWLPWWGFGHCVFVGWRSREVAVFGPVAVSFGGNDFCMVDEPVDHGGGEDGVSEDFAPTSERFVGGDDDRGSFVAG